MRHDFRAFYHTRYEDVGLEEAIDLILTLPAGSLYATKKDPALAWDRKDYMLANIYDVLSVQAHNMYLKDKWAPTQRPADSKIRASAKAKSKSVKEKLSTTQWEEVT